MAQKINLNVSPYYDDYDSSKNFHKILYKPGFPIQARELTQQQSILQNQVESFGDHIFKEGSVVIPGGVAFDKQFQAVKLNTSNYGIDISVYINNFIGKKITGDVSGVSALVKFVALPNGADVTDPTIYVTYLSADSSSDITTFTDGESLSCTENVIYGNTTINSGTPFASLISSNATAVGSAAFVSKGVYFIRGYFVNVEDQTIILDHYSNNPSYRVGLSIDESLVNAKEDESLYDNAKGFTNFAAPGADRLKITLTLSKKELTDKNDTNFVEIMRLDEGKVKVMQSKSDYNKIRDYLAKRTYQESGDYSVSPFSMSFFDSLNDNLGNGGLFFDGDTTEQLNTPSDDLMCLKLSPGVAYVRGYEVEKVATEIIDVEKPRDVGIRSDVGFSFAMGNVLKVNNVSGSPKQGSVVKLFSQFNAGGENIGSARVYNFSLEDSAYVGASSRWDLRLFDIQTNTNIVLNQAVSATEAPSGSFIEGRNSGAVGYTINAGNNSTVITVNQTGGDFIVGEELNINGIPSSRTVGVVTSFNTQGIKSVEQPASTGFPQFKADSVLELFGLPGGVMQVSINGNTVTAGQAGFQGLRKGSTVRFLTPGNDQETYNKVEAVGSGGTSLTLSAISPSVAGVFDGNLVGAATTLVVDMFAGAPVITGSGTLYSPLPHNDVASVDLKNSRLKITKQLTSKTVSNNTLTLDISSDVTSSFPELTDAVFEPFDQERYSVFVNGTPQAISNDTFSFLNGGDDISISNLSNGSNNTLINVSLTKNGIKTKQKEYTRSTIVNITRSKFEKSGSTAVGNGAKQIADGLTFDRRHGLRVQDNIICLNHPDVVKVLAVYESLNSSAPTLDVLQFSSTSDVSNNAIIGENIVSEETKIVARVVTKPESNKLGVVYLTSDKFNLNESVKFTESNIKTNIDAIELGAHKDITNLYTLQKGQKQEFYDYSSIIRSQSASEPSGQLLVVFDQYTVPEDDDGDVFTVLSYDQERFKNDIPSIDFHRASDTLDFRPRVSVYNPDSSSESPFIFKSRDFSSSIKQYLTPDETSFAGFEYYLPRIDSIFLNKFGDFVYEKGIPSLFPKAPVKKDDVMQLATVRLPAYMYNTQSARFVLNDNRRFTMRDIGKIQDRVKNLEEVTSLSLLEVSAQTLQLLDSDGRNRFKSGFFVDSFKNYSFIDRDFSTVQVNPDGEELIPFRSRDTLASQVTPAQNLISSELDFNTDFPLLDPNVKKTGDAVTLNYEEVEWITQPYATKSNDVNDIINVNPYELPVLSGNVELDPRMDVWTRTVQLEDNVIRQTGVNNVESLNLEMSGSGSLDLGSIRMQASGINMSLDAVKTVTGTRSFLRKFREKNKKQLRPLTNLERARLPGWARNRNYMVWKDMDTETLSDSTTIKGSASDSLTVSNTDTTIQNNLVSSATDDFMRSRNIQYVSSGFMDFSRVYLWMDGQQIFDIIPKLLEITPTIGGTDPGSVGTFKIGEEVHALDSSGNIIMKFRLCQPNHKSGAYDSPTEVYTSNPYTNGLEIIPANYSQSSAILNVDTKSLSEEAQGQYFGYLTTGSLLIGQESTATAHVKDVKLITDSFGDVTGSMFIRDPHSIPVPPVRIKSGVKNFKLTTSPTNRLAPPGQDASIMFAETQYSAIGTFEEWQDTVTITENTTTVNANASFSAEVDASLDLNTPTSRLVRLNYVDPLAQTFVVGGNVQAPSAINANRDLNGAFITTVEVFFATVDTVTNSPIRCEIRSVTGDARPSMTLIGKSKTLRPITTNAAGETITVIEADPNSASVGTKFTFPEPIYLAPGNSYAFVLVAEKSVGYNVWTGRHGGVAVNPDTIQTADEGASLIYSTQYGAGSIFKSQNGALWTEDQSQDMTFKLYKAKFTSSNGTVSFNNPELNESNDYVSNLNSNSVRTFPKTGSIGITTVSKDDAGATQLIAALAPGRKITGNKLSSTAVIVGTGCSVKSVVTTRGGTNYGDGTEVGTFAITGQGSGLTLSFSEVSGAVPTTPTIVNAGTGYKIGDVVGIVTADVTGDKGRDALITITDNGGIDTLYLTNIQADSTSFQTGIGISYFNDLNVITSVGATGEILSSNLNSSGRDSGTYMRVSHFNHGMYSANNKVEFSNIESDVAPTVVSSLLGKTETAVISVGSTSQFLDFEGIPVSGINTGYVKIGSEIIGYQSVGNGVLNIASGSGNQRGVDNTIPIDHQIGSEVKKHEISGVSIRRLEVDTQNVDALDIDLDSYHISFDRTKNGLVRAADTATIPQLSFSKDAFVGGRNMRASQNILYGAVVPRYQVITPTGVDGSSTSIQASIRTVTGTSVSGNEVSFIDGGVQPVQLNRYNALDTVRIVASKVNENQYLSGLPRNKSFTTLLNLNSSNEDISPIVYIDGGSETEFINHRLNRPINLETYNTDPRVNSLVFDPHAAIYVSTPVFLKSPATSIKVILEAVREESSDFRVLYYIDRADSSEIQQTFDLFPGFLNTQLVDGGDVVEIDRSKNDGRPDEFVSDSREDEFKEYQFTNDNLPEFRGFAIKIVMSGSNQAKPVRIKNLRAIAIA